MEIKRFSRISQIEKIYREFDNHVRPFQKYDLVKYIFSFAYWAEPLLYNAKKMRKFSFFVVYDNEKPVLIAPGTMDKTTFCVMGDKEWDYVDLVYKTDNAEYLSDVLNCLFVHLREQGIEKISWRYLEEASISHQALMLLRERGLDVFCTEDISVNISLDFDSHEEYFSSLSKSTRQNCRTAYNRLKRDGKEITLKTYFAEKGRELSKIPEAKKAYKKCMRLYLERQKKRYHQHWMYRLRNRFYDYATRAIPKCDGFISVLYFNGEIAAFMLGFQDKKHQSVILPKLAIVDEFEFYSPGLLLINETAKRLMQDGAFRNIDLCEGDEKYKTVMGGKNYLTNKIRITL